MRTGNALQSYIFSVTVSAKASFSSFWFTVDEVGNGVTVTTQNNGGGNYPVDDLIANVPAYTCAFFSGADVARVTTAVSLHRIGCGSGFVFNPHIAGPHRWSNTGHLCQRRINVPKSSRDDCRSDHHFCSSWDRAIRQPDSAVRVLYCADPWKYLRFLPISELRIFGDFCRDNAHWSVAQRTGQPQGDKNRSFVQRYIIDDVNSTVELKCGDQNLLGDMTDKRI